MSRLTFTALLLILTAPALGALTPTFTKIADNTITPGIPAGSESAFYFENVKVNSSGVAVFAAHAPTTPNSNNAIYMGSGGPLTTVVDGTSAASAFSFGFGPDIDGLGDVVFVGGLKAGGAGIFARRPNGTFTTVVLQDANFDQPINFNPRVSGNGTIAFTGSRDGTHMGIYRTTVNGGGAAAVVTLSEDTGPLNTYSEPGVNNAGKVAFVARGDAINDQQLVIADGNTVTPLITNNPFNNWRAPELNNADQIGWNTQAAIGRINPDLSGTNLGDVQAASPYSSLISSAPHEFELPGLADNGTMAFGANLRSGGSGLFIGPNPATDKIIADGDPLFGSTLKDFAFDRGISDNGQYVAFLYELNNGERGIAIATLPEPSSIALLMLGGAGVFRRRRLPPTP